MAIFELQTDERSGRARRVCAIDIYT